MASRSSEYLKKLKVNNPEKYHEYIVKQREYMKRHRENIKQELKKQNPTRAVLEKEKIKKQHATIRQKRYMERKLASGAVEIVTSNKTHVDRREMNKLAKRKERAQHTPQKKACIRKKDRERKGARNENMSKSETYNMLKTQYNSVTNARKNLPSTAIEYATVLLSLMNNCTHRK